MAPILKPGNALPNYLLIIYSLLFYYAGESDGRRLEDLETLTWNPHNPLSSSQLRDYFATAKAIGLFAQAVDTCHEGGLDEDEDDLDEDLLEERPFEILRLDPTTTNSSEQDANSIFSSGNHHHQNKAGNSNCSNAGSSVAAGEQTKASITTRQQRLQQQKSSVESSDAGGNTSATSSSSSSSSLSPLKHTTNMRIQTALKGLVTKRTNNFFLLPIFLIYSFLSKVFLHLSPPLTGKGKAVQAVSPFLIFIIDFLYFHLRSRSQSKSD